MTTDAYLIDISEMDIEPLIDAWQWMFDEDDEIEPFLMNCFGDLFFLDADGVVLWLNISDGELSEVAASEDEFTQLLENDEQTADWFLPGLVDDLLDAGKTLKPDECFAFRTLPVLGGEYETDNVIVYSIRKYWEFCGAVHSQVAGLPDGTEIEINVADWPPTEE